MEQTNNSIDGDGGSAVGACKALQEVLGEKNERAVYHQLCALLDKLPCRQDLEVMLTEHLDTFCLCSSVSSACCDKVEELLLVIAEQCSPREVYTFSVNNLRESLHMVPFSWNPIHCLVSCIAKAMLQIQRRKYLYISMSSDLNLVICRKASQCLAALCKDNDGSCILKEQVEGIVSKLLANTLLAVRELGIPYSEQDKGMKKAHSKLKFHCLRLLDACCTTAQCNTELCEIEDWEAILCDALEILGMKSLSAFELGGSEGLTDEENSDEEASASAEQLMGASIAVGYLMNDEHKSSHLVREIDCPSLMKSCWHHLDRMLSHAGSGPRAHIIFDKALRLTYLFIHVMEEKGGVSSPTTYQDKIMDHLIRMTTHIPDSTIRSKGWTCIQFLLRMLNVKLRCVTAMRIIEKCHYMSMRAVMISFVKDEIVAAWPINRDQDTKCRSPFLERSCIDKMLMPIHNIDQCEDDESRKEYVQDNSDVLLSAINALRFLILREQKASKQHHVTHVLEEESLSKLKSSLLPSLEVGVSSALVEYKSMNAVAECHSKNHGTCKSHAHHNHPDHWEKQDYLKLLALETVIQRLREIINID